jgi:hypothetical protein
VFDGRIGKQGEGKGGGYHETGFWMWKLSGSPLSQTTHLVSLQELFGSAELALAREIKLVAFSGGILIVGVGAGRIEGGALERGPNSRNLLSRYS